MTMNLTSKVMRKHAIVSTKACDLNTKPHV